MNELDYYHLILSILVFVNFVVGIWAGYKIGRSVTLEEEIERLEKVSE